MGAVRDGTSSASGGAGPSRPFLTVVVTAYRRRQFLGEAVRSVLDQDLARDEYEVVVLKDFEDAELDAELEREAPTVRVHTEDIPRMGAMIAQGVALARGDVVCFLEDDDRFRPGKLRGLREIFRGSPDVGFVRNAYAGIDAEGRALPSWEQLRPQPAVSARLAADGRGPTGLAYVYRYGLAINLSTMAVRTEILRPWLPLFREVPASPDLFVFLLAAVAERPMLSEAHRWNDYRVHASTSHAALVEGNEAKDLADTVRSEATAAVMERVVAQSPGHTLAERFVACYRSEVTAVRYLLDPAARWSVGGWFGLWRTFLWRRQRYLAAVALFAVYRALSPVRGMRAYRRWRFRALRSAAGTPG